MGTKVNVLSPKRGNISLTMYQ